MFRRLTKARYLFDCDGWQIRNPPDLDQLRLVDPHLADLAGQSVQRFKAVAAGADEAEMDYYSAYSSKFKLARLLMIELSQLIA